MSSAPGVPPGTPPPPEAESQVTLKRVHISGTPLTWTLGVTAAYTNKDGEAKTAKVVGMAVAKPPKPHAPGCARFGTTAEDCNCPPSFTVQVHVQFEGGYTDIYIVEDHLVVKNIEVSQLVKPKTTILVPKR